MPKKITPEVIRAMQGNKEYAKSVPVRMAVMNEAEKKAKMFEGAKKGRMTQDEYELRLRNIISRRKRKVVNKSKK